MNEESGMTSTYSSFTDRTRTERWGIEVGESCIQSGTGREARQCAAVSAVKNESEPDRILPT